MRLKNLLRPAACLLAAAALASCDLLPGARVAGEQAAADTGAVFGDTAGASQTSDRPRRRRPTRSAASGGQAGAAAESTSDTGAAAPVTPAPPTAAQRARSTMSTDLRRLADAQAEHLANEGRYSSRISRLGLRYIPHAGVSVQLLSGDGAGWSAVATHESFPHERCAIWMGEAPPSLTGIAPAEGVPGCATP
jgi:hypothetical protein